MLEASWAIAWAATAVDWTTVVLDRVRDKFTTFTTFWDQVLALEHWAAILSQRQNGWSARWALLFAWFVIVVVNANVFDWAGTLVVHIALGVDGLDLLTAGTSWHGDSLALIAWLALVTNVLWLILATWSRHVAIKSLELALGAGHIWWSCEIARNWFVLDLTSNATSVPDARVLGADPYISDLVVSLAIHAAWALGWWDTLALMADSARWAVATLAVKASSLKTLVLLVVSASLSDALATSLVNHISSAFLMTTTIRSPLNADTIASALLGVRGQTVAELAASAAGELGSTGVHVWLEVDLGVALGEDGVSEAIAACALGSLDSGAGVVWWLGVALALVVLERMVVPFDGHLLLLTACAAEAGGSVDVSETGLNIPHVLTWCELSYDLGAFDSCVEGLAGNELNGDVTELDAVLYLHVD